ncbi:MAG: CAP domain-containing protein [Elainellaceae cyanobacterium]
MLRDRAGNTRANARKINFKSGKGTLKDWVGQSDTDDYYSFRVKSSSKLKLKLQGLKADANLEFLDRKGRLIASSSRRGRRNEKLKVNELDSGKYFIRVTRERGNTTYKLRFVSKELSTGGSIGGSTNGSTGGSTGGSTNGSNNEADPFIQEVLDLTNQERATAGLQPLTLDIQLNRAAQEHSESMAVDDFFDHTGVDGSSPFDRINAEGYDYQRAAENVAAGYATPEAVVEGWMSSPGHRANILNANLAELGVGYYYLANDTGSVNYNHYWTQVFATPLS